MEKEVNPHFEDFLFNWIYKFYFLVGGYGSSKSYHVALKIILKLLKEKRTALVVREVYDTIRDSCFALFEEIIHDLELEDQVRLVTSPMQIRFPNGSKIIFKGMDKPSKLKSIHNVSLVWLEECSEIKYEGFKELIGRLRHPTLQLYMILSTNPVSKSNWTYTHFFRAVGIEDEQLYKDRILIANDTYYHHSIADDNLFLPQSYIDQLEDLKTHDPDLWRIARKGRFGVSGKIVFPQFEVNGHEAVMSAIKAIRKPLLKNGMDFGMVVSYNALLRLAIDHEQKILYVYWEYYSRDKTDPEIAEDIKEFAESRELIKADCAEPKAIKYYKQKGFKILPCKKFQGSRATYTKKVKRFKKIVCSDTCVNTIAELKELTFKTDRNGEIIEDEFNIDPHTLSAIWYALDDYEVSDLKGGGLQVMK